MGQEILDLLGSTFWMILGIAAIFAIYLAISGACWFVYNLATKSRSESGYGSLKTVTFGDESSVVANRIASFAAVVAVFLLWGIATGSKLLPFTLPQPFVGDTQFEYTVANAAGETDTGTVFLRVHKFGEEGVQKPEGAGEGDGFAKDDVLVVAERRSKILKAQSNDGEDTKEFKVTEVNGQAISPGNPVNFGQGMVEITSKGSLFVKPSTGWTMEALYLPPPEQVWSRFWQLNAEGYQNIGLWENVFWSLIRVVVGFFLGCLFGIPLGFAMGLNSWMRGWFDPIVEFMRPVPPLALIPLVIIWFGIGEQGKISLLFLAALWIMTIAARAGVSGVNISKVHAAYSLGATKKQVLRRVILPNSLPEIFTGARVAMGVCWGTIVGIILIGVIGYGIDILMRRAEDFLVPWKGKG